MAQFGEFDPGIFNTTNRKAAVASSGRGKINRLKIQDGERVRIRFMPSKPGKRAIVAVFEHYIRLPTGQVGFTCPQEHGGTHCPACATAITLKASKNKADQERAKMYMPKQRYNAVVINRADEATGPQVFTFGSTIMKALKELFEDEEYGNFLDPEKGYDIIISRAGEGTDTEYTVKPARGNGPIHKDAAKVDQWMNDAPDIDGFDKPKSLEEIEAKLKFGPKGRPEGAEGSMSSESMGEENNAETQW